MKKTEIPVFINSINTPSRIIFLKQYPSMRSVYFKKFSTQQERSFLFHAQAKHILFLNICVARGNRLHCLG